MKETYTKPQIYRVKLDPAQAAAPTCCSVAANNKIQYNIAVCEDFPNVYDCAPCGDIGICGQNSS